MLYTLFRPITRWAFLAFFRKIHITGLDRIPRDQPLILTVNHPTAFVEPCFLACFGPRVLHFMTRGDVFTSPFVRWLLRQVHLIPIYRFHDGFAALRLNEASFAKARKILGRRGTILIMAEGKMGHEKRLRPLQKGAARIGFGAMDEYHLEDVMIQPIGINYTYAERARKEIMVDVAEPFSLAGYVEEYRRQPNQTLGVVTDRIRTALEQRVIHIDQKQDEALGEWVLQLVRIRPATILPVVEGNPQVLQVEWEAMTRLNGLDTRAKEQLRLEMTPYFQALEERQLEDEVVARNPHLTAGSRLLRIPILVLHPLVYICHWPPVQLGRWITRRTVRIIEFRSSVLLGSIMVGWALWWLGWSTVLTVGYSWIGILFLVVFPLSAGWSVVSGEWLRQCGQARVWQKLAPEVRQHLMDQRDMVKRKWLEVSGTGSVPEGSGGGSQDAELS